MSHHSKYLSEHPKDRAEAADRVRRKGTQGLSSGESFAAFRIGPRPHFANFAVARPGQFQSTLTGPSAQRLAGFASLTALALCALSCTSTSKIDSIDTQLEKKGTTPTESVGIDSTGKAVVQKQSSASSRLVTLEHVNENLKLDLRQQFFLLRQCRENLALSQHGGSGEYPELTDFDALEAQYDKKSQLGMEKGELKVVETSDLQERIKAQEAFQTELTTFIRTVKKEHDKCAFAMRERKSANTPEPLPMED